MRWVGGVGICVRRRTGGRRGRGVRGKVDSNTKQNTYSCTVPSPPKKITPSYKEGLKSAEEEVKMDVRVTREKQVQTT